MQNRSKKRNLNEFFSDKEEKVDVKNSKECDSMSIIFKMKIQSIRFVFKTMKAQQYETYEQNSSFLKQKSSGK